MRKKQEEFYKTYHKLGRTEEAAEVALGEVYSIKTWSKANRKKQLEKLLCSDEGKLYLERLEKTKKVIKKLEKNIIDLEESSEKTASNIFGKKKVGRKTLYNSQADSVAREILALGGHDLDVQAALGISERTYYRWKIDHPSFYRSILSGKDFFSVEQVEASLIRRAKGGHFLKEIITKEDAAGNIIERIIKEKEQDSETNAKKTLLFNRAPGRWSEKPGLSAGTSDKDEERKKLEEQSGEQREIAEKILEKLSSGTLTEE